MEDVLSVYTRPYDSSRPVVCFDEMPKTLHAPSRPALPVRPATDEHDGTPHREDYEYVRCGTANLFLSYEPLANYRHVAVTERRTRTDWADAIKDLVEVQYPDAKRIILVLDNLNIHSPASLYQAFPAAEACRLTEKLEIHYTPKHGSWLNMAEMRALHPLPAVPRPPHSLYRRVDGAGRGLGGGTQPRSERRELALHHRRCAHQAPPTLPGTLTLKDH